MLTYYIIDIETTGLRCGYHEICEIAIIRASDRMQLHRYVQCQYPERSSLDALQVTGKSLQDLTYGIPPQVVVEECNKFLNEDGLTPQHRCIVGHNIFNFDKRFLFNLWSHYQIQFPAVLWLDTIPLTRIFAKKLGIVKPKLNLHAACDLVGVNKFAQAHNAKMDSRNNYLLWKDLVEIKKIDYLSFIKTAVHQPIQNSEDEEPDMSLLEGLYE